MNRAGVTPKRAFIIILRIVFVFSTLQFMRDVFYKWDGYSYYMRFADFLPDLSLTYIAVGIYAVFFSASLWLGVYIIYKILPKSLNVRFGHLLSWIILCVLLLVLKKIIIKKASLTELFGLNYFVILTISSGVVAFIVWVLRKHIEKILDGLDIRIAPLVWIFMFFLILALPFSFLKMRFNEIHHDIAANVKLEKDQYKKLSHEKGPNIILVVMDALTANDMQLYGYYRHTTPFLSEWAKTSVVFKRAYSSSNWTTPATMSMLTGQRPWTHKVWYRAYYKHVKGYEKNLPRVLKDYGYDTYGLVQNPYADPEVLGIEDFFSKKGKSYAFSRPPDSISGKVRRYFINRPVAADWILNVQPIVNALINHFRAPVRETSVPPDLVYNRFIKYLSNSVKGNKKQDMPFFAWLHVYPPHSWYLPPKPYQDMFGDGDQFNTDIKQGKVTGKEYSPDKQPQIDILRKRYDEFIVYSDRQFEMFMSRLAETIDMSNTILILTSDHGESFSHGYQEHDGPHLYEQLVHVPLLIRLPGTQAGKIINVSVEQTDIAPTILELAGISVPDWMEGRSLVPLLQGGEFKPRPVYSMQLIKNRSFGHPINNGTIAVWDGDYKLIYYLQNSKTLLFNLLSDPDETSDLSIDKNEIKNRLLKLIQENLSIKNAVITESNVIKKKR